MPRNSSGTYTLPAGNPVAPNTLIETNWANPTMSDLASALTDSLDRLGRGTMLAPLKIFDGTAIAPALSFNSEATMGLFRPIAGALGISVAGGEVARFTTAALELFAGLAVAGAVTLSGGIGVTGDVRLTGPVGIGAPAALVPLTAPLMISTNAAPFTGAMPTFTNLHIVGANGGVTRAVVDAVGGNAVFQGRRANGTLAAPTQVLSTEPIASWGGSGHNGVAWPSGFNGGIFLEASETFTAIANGTHMRFNVTAIGATANLEQMRLTGAGNLGIGTATPNKNAAGRALTLNGSTNAIYELCAADVLTGWLFGSASRVTLETSGAIPLTFQVNGAERMRIATAGNVGIGTIAPVANLHVTNGNPAVSGSLSLSPTTVGGGASFLMMGNSDSGGAAGPFVMASANRVLQFGVGTSFASSSGGTFTEWARLDNGNLGIGGAPGVRLDAFLGVNGDIIRARNSVSAFEAKLGTDASSAYLDSGNTDLVLKRNGTEYVRVAAGGTVNLVAGSGSLRMAGGITRFESAEQAAPLGGSTTTVAHGGPRAPDLFRFFLRCKVADLGYLVGDEILITPSDAGDLNRFYTSIGNATNCVFVYASAIGAAVMALRATRGTGANTGITPASWAFFVRAHWL